MNPLASNRPTYDRIVACVNSCAGIPTKMLTDMGDHGWLWNMLKNIARYNERNVLPLPDGVPLD